MLVKAEQTTEVPDLMESLWSSGGDRYHNAHQLFDQSDENYKAESSAKNTLQVQGKVKFTQYHHTKGQLIRDGHAKVRKHETAAEIYCVLTLCQALLKAHVILTTASSYTASPELCYAPCCLPSNSSLPLQPLEVYYYPR